MSFKLGHCSDKYDRSKFNICKFFTEFIKSFSNVNTNKREIRIANRLSLL